MSQPTILPVAEYLPDMPDFPASGSSNIKNVYPRTPLSYGAINSPAPVSSALLSQCRGAAAFIDNLGTVNIFAGDANNLYRLVAGDAYVWELVTRTVGGAYGVTVDDYWEFDYFNGSALACNLTDNIQTFNLLSDTKFSDLAGSPPRAKHLAVVKNAFVMLGNTFDGVSQNQPQRVWWSAAGNATSWPTPGSVTAAQVQSGFVDLFGSEGAVQAVRSGLTSADALIFQQYGIRRAVYSGPPEVFEFLPAQNVRGTPAPHSPVVIGGTCYYFGYDGWYSYDGATSEPIGANKVDKTFMDNLDDTHSHLIVGAADPRSKMIWWAYPGKGGAGQLTKMIGYNWQLQRWTPADLVVEMLARTISLGYTLDQLGTVLGFTLDTLPAPLDSSIWAGGALQLGVFDTAHKLNYLTGPAMAAIVETSEMQPITGRRAGIISARPLIDGSGVGAPSVSIGHRERQQNVVTYAQATALNRLGLCPQRTSGRYLRAQMTVQAGGDWTNISGVEVEVVGQGKR